MLFAKYFQKLSDTQLRVIKNVLWAVTGKLANLFGVFFVGILVARYLGPEQYGIMNYVISYVTLFTVVASFGLEDIEIREFARHNEKKNMIFGSAFALRLILSTIAYLMVAVSLLFYDVDRHTCIMILLYAFSLFPTSVNVIRNYFTSIVLNEYVVKSEILRTVISSIIKISFLWFKLPVECFILAMALDFYIVASGYIYSYRKMVGKIKDWYFDKDTAKLLVKEAFPLLLSGAAVIIYQRIDQVMVTDMISTTMGGYYATAGQIVNMVMIVPLIFVQTITPILVRIRKTDPLMYDKKKIQFVSIVTWSSVVIAAVVFLLSYPLIRILFGENYVQAVPILHIMVWKTVAMALSASAGQLIIIENIQKWAAIRNFLACFMCVLLNYILIPIMGVNGAAWASLITLSCSAYLFNILIPPYYPLMKLQTKSLLWGWKYAYDYVRKF